MYFFFGSSNTLFIIIKIFITNFSQHQANNADSGQLTDQLQAARTTLSNITDERDAVIKDLTESQQQLDQARQDRAVQEDELVGFVGRIFHLCMCFDAHVYLGHIHILCRREY